MENKYLGIDWGEKRIGLALGDGHTRLASPYGLASSLEDVLDAIKKEDAKILVLGLPLKMSGDKRGIPAEFEDFFRQLKDRSGCPVELMDERLSSKAADALPGGKKDKAERDALAAMLILQSYFDRKIQD